MKRKMKKRLTVFLAAVLAFCLAAGNVQPVLAETAESVTETESEAATESLAATEDQSAVEESESAEENAEVSENAPSEEESVAASEDVPSEEESTAASESASTEEESTAASENVPSEEESAAPESESSEEESESAEESSAAAESETDGEDYDSMKEQTLSVMISETVTVTAEIPAGAFAEPVELSVEIIDVDSDEQAGQILNRISEMIGQEQKSMMGAYMADISFLNAEGEEAEPAEGNSVKVTVTTAPIDMNIPADADTDLLDAAVYHVVDGEADDLDSWEIELDDENRFVGMSFESDSFSPFVGVVMTKPMTLEEPAGTVYYVDDDFKEDVPAENKYTTIQKAIDAIRAAQNGVIDGSDTGYVINVAAGTYDRFLVYHRLENIVIQGAGDDTVIKTFDETSQLSVASNEVHSSDGFGIIIWGADITLKDMKIVSGTDKSVWYASAVGTNDIQWGSSHEIDTAVVLDNCTFEGSGVGFAFMPQRSKFTVNDCTISNYDHAIYFAGDGFETQDYCKITNNTIKNCIFAIHGYYGGADSLELVKPMEISGNTISGTADRYSVIAIMDQPGGDSDKGSVKLDISGNIFSYTIVGGINMRKDEDVAQGSMEAVRDANTLTNYSYVADAYWYTGTDYGTTYYVKSPEGKIATWFASPTSEAGKTPEKLEAIKKALEEHGTAGDVIEISSAEYNQEMFTMAKNALAIQDFVDAGDLQIQKRVSGKADDDTTFYFTVAFTRENGKQLNGVYDVVMPDGKTEEIKLVNGKFTFALKNGESITVKDMLPGTKYLVTENSASDYETSYEGVAGSIVAKQTQVAAFTNTYIPSINRYETSKAKTATNLDGNYDSDVTLALPSGTYNGKLDVAFVLDGSTSVDAYDLVDQAAYLLDELSKIENLDVKVSLTVFGGTVPILESTGLLSIADDSYLKALKQKLRDKSYDGIKGRSGSNLQAGVEDAKAVLDADTSVESCDKYLIILSDGAARMWYEDNDGDGQRDALSQTYQWDKNGTKIGWNQNGDFDYFRYGDNVSYRKFSEIWSDGQSGKQIGNYAATEAQKNAASVQDTHIVAPYEVVMNGEYYTTYEAATYYAATSIMKAKKSANVIMISYPYDVDHTTQQNIYDYIVSFMEWVGKNGVNSFSSDKTNAAEIFAGVKDNLLQVVDAGSRVVDVIGYGTDNKGNDYDFDFVNKIENMKLTVGDEILDVTRISDTKFAFGAADGSKNGKTYPFFVTYYEKGFSNINGPDDVFDECFIWEINVPVTVDKPVKLTYTVHLTNPQTAAGTYGTYDEYGSEKYENLWTNRSAVLYPVDSDGQAGEKEVFEKPTVSYTVTKKPSEDPKPGTSTEEDTPDVPVVVKEETVEEETVPVDVAGTMMPAADGTVAGARTGDSSHVAVWLILAAASILAMTSVALFRNVKLRTIRRKRKK